MTGDSIPRDNPNSIEYLGLPLRPPEIVSEELQPAAEVGSTNDNASKTSDELGALGVSSVVTSTADEVIKPNRNSVDRSHIFGLTERYPMSTVRPYIFESSINESKFSAQTKPKPAGMLGRAVEAHIEEVQADAREKLTSIWPELGPDVVKGLKHLAQSRSVYGQTAGGHAPSFERSMASHIGLSDNFVNNFNSLRWLVYRCFDQDNEVEYWVYRVYMKPLREHLLSTGVVEKGEYNDVYTW